MNNIHNMNNINNINVMSNMFNNNMNNMYRINDINEINQKMANLNNHIVNIIDFFIYNQKLDIFTGENAMFCNFCGQMSDAIYQNSLITESFNHKEDLKKNLSAIEKENEQLQVNIEKSLNLNNVEQSAKEMLGMQKLDNSQKVYVSIPKEDYVESETEKIIVEEETNWFDKLIEAIKSIFK